MQKITPSLADTILIVQSRIGDEAATSTLVKKYTTRLRCYIVTIVKDDALADDLLQDTFLKALKALREGLYVEGMKFGEWIFRIAHNHCCDHFRRQKRFRTFSFESTIEDTGDGLNALLCCDNNDALAKKESILELRRFIHMLPKPQRDVIIMHYYFNLKFKDIAIHMNTSANTALGRMRYAVINLRKFMKKAKEKEALLLKRA